MCLLMIVAPCWGWDIFLWLAMFRCMKLYKLCRKNIDLQIKHNTFSNKYFRMRLCVSTMVKDESWKYFFLVMILIHSHTFCHINKPWYPFWAEEFKFNALLVPEEEKLVQIGQINEIVEFFEFMRRIYALHIKFRPLGSLNASLSSPSANIIKVGKFINFKVFPPFHSLSFYHTKWI